jgi:hypothetical protein
LESSGPEPQARGLLPDLLRVIAITEEMQKFKAFLTIQQTRAFQRLHDVENLTNKHSKVMGFN